MNSIRKAVKTSKEISIAENIIRIDDIELNNSAKDIIAIVDLSSVIRWINISVLFYTGEDQDFFINKRLSALLLKEDLFKVKNIFKLLKNGSLEKKEIQLRLKNSTGVEFWFETLVLPVSNSHSELIACQLVFHDITDKVKAEERREIERARVMKAMIDGQEMERQRISMELHDGLGQKLTGIKMKLENASRSDLKKTRELLNDLKEDFRQIIDEIRMISANISPAVISHWGLTNSLADLCKQFERNSGMDCEFSVEGNFDNVVEQKSFCIYRIVQEGLTNIAKHSKGTQAKLFLIEKEKNLLILIEDNGVGIKKEQIGQIKGNGLSNIKQRVGLLGGNVNIGNIKNSGTIIFVRLPK